MPNFPFIERFKSNTAWLPPLLEAGGCLTVNPRQEPRAPSWSPAALTIDQSVLQTTLLATLKNLLPKACQGLVWQQWCCLCNQAMAPLWCLQGQGLLSVMDPKWPHILYDRNWRQELIQRPWRVLLTGLLSCFLINSRTTSPGRVPATMC